MASMVPVYVLGCSCVVVVVRFRTLSPPQILDSPPKLIIKGNECHQKKKDKKLISSLQTGIPRGWVQDRGEKVRASGTTR